MESFHVTKDGPRICSAYLRKCPYETHFESRLDARDFFEAEMEKLYAPLKKKIFSRAKISKLFRIGELEVKEKHFPELDYVLGEIDKYSPEDRPKRLGSIFFSPSKAATRRWFDSSWMRSNTYGGPPAVEATVDPDEIFAYPIEDYERVSNKLGNLWISQNKNAEGLGINPEPSEELAKEIQEYWNSGVTLGELWGKVASGKIKEEDLKNYEIFVPREKLESFNVRKSPFSYSKE